ncbi:sensor histidine kinase [Actinoplanes couchii]|uniref:histidine kinase n=1 Tax=Actinoplanes couchii TaxID=403638 RepID=A0ABQ3XR61_9ACTN|nr:ATP-binding protein [Actinoplanes couchii]MDR6318209.1 signal transduction histidine kinase [Actinoplanes couchii]GID61003.1 two-component sensor histidine kinase [Actinoplanes couchii]
MTTDPPVSRGSSVPARWRITGWILLATTIALTAVIVTVRSALLADGERRANAELVQEAAEFSAFLAEGVDPTTAQAFTSPDRVLEVYLNRQHPDDDEVLLGLVGADVLQADRPGRGVAAAPYDLAADAGLLAAFTDPAHTFGTTGTPAGPMRWGRVDVGAATARGSLVIAIFTEQRRDETDQVVRLMALVSLGGLLLTLAIGWIAAGRILAPVRALHEVAADIGERDLTVRVPVHGRDDIAAMAETFNAMLDRLEEAYGLQRRFVDDAAHELRTPITVIRGHLELLGDDPAERAHTLRLVDDELARMSRIVSDLLVLARAERPDFVNARPVETTDLMLDIEAKCQALADRSWLLGDIAEGAVTIDGQRVTQAVLQLAANAVQHTADGDEIRMGSRFEGVGDRRRLLLWVSDTGPGVRPEEVEEIFERFHHGSATRAGAGLGLAIVRAIADAHGGRAFVRSTPGEGATFGLDLPAPDDTTEVINA